MAFAAWVENGSTDPVPAGLRTAAAAYRAGLGGTHDRNEGLITLLLLVLSPVTGWAAAWVEMYPADRLVRETSRLESRANQMLDITVKLARQGDLSEARSELLANIRISAPVADDRGVPLDFASRYSKNAGTVITPICSACAFAIRLTPSSSRMNSGASSPAIRAPTA
jgi:hypothetical protein